MGLTIKANTFLTQRYLTVAAEGIVYCETGGGKRKFRFEQIFCVCMSSDNVLSFQVGQEVFTLKVKPHKRKHQEVISSLLRELAETLPAARR